MTSAVPPNTALQIGDLVTDWLNEPVAHPETRLKNATIEHYKKLVTLEMRLIVFFYFWVCEDLLEHPEERRISNTTFPCLPSLYSIPNGPYSRNCFLVLQYLIMFANYYSF